jgi:hypothetical protein
MSKRMYWLGVGVVLVALAFVVVNWLLPDPTPPIVNRIKPGMGLDEFVKLIGRHGVNPYSSIIMRESQEGARLIWDTPEGRVVVTFDNRNWVVRGSVFKPHTPSPWSRIRAWLGW